MTRAKVTRLIPDDDVAALGCSRPIAEAPASMPGTACQKRTGAGRATQPSVRLATCT